MSKLSDEQIRGVSDALVEAVGAVTLQGKEQLQRFGDKYAPAVAYYVAQANDQSNPQRAHAAARVLRHLRMQVLGEAATYGVAVETAGISAVWAAVQAVAITASKVV